MRRHRRLVTTILLAIMIWSNFAGWDDIPLLGSSAVPAAGLHFSPQVGELGQLPGVEIVTVGADGSLLVWNRDHTLAAGFPKRFSGWLETSPVLVDSEGDGVLEIAAVVRSTTGSYELHLVRGNGAEMPNYPQSLGIIPGASPVAGDLDGDGSEEIVVCGETGDLRIFGLGGSKSMGLPTLPSRTLYPASADLNGDGRDDLIFTDGSGQIHTLLSSAESWYPLAVFSHGEPMGASPALFKNDAEWWMAVADLSGQLTSYRFEAQQWRLSAGPFPVAKASFLSSPIMGDMDGDLQPEMGAVAADNMIYALQGDGQPIIGFPRRMPSTASSGLGLLGDMANGGTRRIIYALKGTEIHILGLVSGKLNEEVWGPFFHRAALMIDPRTQPMPNPISPNGDGKNDFSVIQYGLASTILTDLKMTVQDASGREVTTLVNKAYTPGGYEDARWDAVGMGSGEFTVKVTAQSAGNPSVSISRPLLVDTVPPQITLKGLQVVDADPGDSIPVMVNSDRATVTQHQYLRFLLAVNDQGASQNPAKVSLQLINAGSGEVINLPEICQATATSFDWQGTDTQGNPIKDGLYRFRLFAEDDAGNRSQEITSAGAVSFVRVDNTPPGVSFYLVPPVVGVDQPETELVYTLNEPVSFPVKVTAIATSENDPAMVKNLFTDKVASANGEYRWLWNTSGLTDGAYRVDLTVRDASYNEVKVGAKVVRNTLLPTITLPQEGQVVAGQVAIKGIAPDPDWQNNKDFTHYHLFVKTGRTSPTVKADGSLDLTGWVPVQVPVASQDPADSLYPQANTAIVPVQVEGVLGYLDTSAAAIQAGENTILLVTEEEGGFYRTATRVVTVDKDAPVQGPQMTMNLSRDAVIPGGPDATDDKLEISCLVSGEDARLAVSVVRWLGTTAGPVVARFFTSKAAAGETVTYTWEGRDALGSYTSSGDYRVLAVAEAIDGSEVVQSEGQFKLVTPLELQMITSGTLHFDPFQAVAGAKVQLPVSYRLSKEAQVTVEVFRGDPRLGPAEVLKTLAKDEAQLGQVVQTKNWDGTSDAFPSNLVAPGSYVLRVKAVADGVEAVAYAQVEVAQTTTANGIIETVLAISGSDQDANGFVETPGSSEFVYTAVGSGKLTTYPPREFNVKVSAQGMQVVKEYIEMSYNIPFNKWFQVTAEVDPLIPIVFKEDHGANYRRNYEPGRLKFEWDRANGLYRVWRQEVLTVKLEKRYPYGGGPNGVYTIPLPAGFLYDRNRKVVFNPENGLTLYMIDEEIHGDEGDGEDRVDLIICYRSPVLTWRASAWQPTNNGFFWRVPGQKNFSGVFYKEIWDLTGDNWLDIEKYGDPAVTRGNLQIRARTDWFHYTDLFDFFWFPNFQWSYAPRDPSWLHHHDQYATATFNILFPFQDHALKETFFGGSVDYYHPQMGLNPDGLLGNDFNHTLLPHLFDFRVDLDVTKKEFVNNPGTGVAVEPLNPQYKSEAIENNQITVGNFVISSNGNTTSDKIYPHKGKVYAQDITTNAYRKNSEDVMWPLPLPEDQIGMPRLLEFQDTNGNGDREYSPETGVVESVIGDKGGIDISEAVVSGVLNYGEELNFNIFKVDGVSDYLLDISSQSRLLEWLTLGDPNTPWQNKLRKLGIKVEDQDSLGHNLIIADVPEGEGLPVLRLAYNPEAGDIANWITTQDPLLSQTMPNGMLQARKGFNNNIFALTNTYSMVDDYPLPADGADTPRPSQQTFLWQGGEKVLNPDLKLEDWQIQLYYIDGTPNQDLVVEKKDPVQNTLTLRLNTDHPRRLVTILGAANGPRFRSYEIFYYQGEGETAGGWKSIPVPLANRGTDGNEFLSLKPVSGVGDGVDNDGDGLVDEEGEPGVLGYLEASVLNGIHTVLIRVTDLDGGTRVATQTIQVGQVVKPTEAATVVAPYRMARLELPAGAVSTDTVITVNPISMEEAVFASRPAVTPVGAVVNLKPAGMSFPSDKRPTLVISVPYEELPSGTTDISEYNIHYLDPSGDLKVLNTTRTWLDLDENGVYSPGDVFVFQAAIDHFSYYAVLKGTKSLKTPVIQELPRITNQVEIMVKGIAEPEAKVALYRDDDPFFAQAEETLVPLKTMVADKEGNFSFEAVALMEGENHLFVAYPGVTSSPVGSGMVIKDTIQPALQEVTVQPVVFSPLLEQKVTFTMTPSEKGQVRLTITDAQGRTVLMKEQEVAGNEPATMAWNGHDEMNGLVPDGTFAFSLWLSDEAGNQMEKATAAAGTITVDTTPPVLDFKAVSAVFSPNGDGVQDTAGLEISSDSKVTLSVTVVNEQGEEVAVLATDEVREADVSSFFWNGKDSGGMVLPDGGYRFRLTAKDTVGYLVSGEIKVYLDTQAPQVKVERVQNGAFYDAPVTPEVSVVDATLAYKAITLNNGAWLPGTVAEKDGVYLLAVEAADAGGNRTSMNVEFMVDQTPPVITIRGVEAGKYYNQSVTPVVEISEEWLAESTVLLDGQPFVSGTAVALEGKHSLEVRAKDKAGNQNGLMIPFTLDMTPPAITVTGVENGGAYRQDVLPSIKVDESNLKSKRLQLNLLPYTEGTVIHNDGQYNLTISAEDLAGNKASMTVEFIVDQTPPRAPVALVAKPGDRKTALAWIPNTERDLAGYNVFRDGVLVARGLFEPAYTDEGLENGREYWYTVTALDQIGNESATSTALRVVPGLDLAITATDLIFPTPPYAGEKVRLQTKIHNTGYAPIQQTTVAFYDGDPKQGGILIARASVVSLDPGAEAIAAVDWVTTQKQRGIHQIYVVADPDKAILEMDEKNNTAMGELLLKDPLNITQGFSFRPRVLVWAETKANRKLAESLRPEVSLLKVVTTADAFISEMRTNKYNVLVVLDVQSPLTDHQDAELAARVYGGTGLVVTRRGNADNFKNQGIFGVKYEGFLGPATRTVNLSVSDLFGELSAVTATGKIERLVLVEKDVRLLGTVAEKKDQYPAAVSHVYGNGKTILFAFDPATVSPGQETGRTMVAQAITYANPGAAETEVFAGEAAALETAVVNLGVPVRIRLTDMPPQNAQILQVLDGGTLDGTVLTWEANLERNEDGKFAFLVRFPDGLAEYTFLMDVDYWYQNTWEPYDQISLIIPVRRDRNAFLQEVINQLYSINTTGGAERTAWEKVMNILNGLSTTPAYTKDQLAEAIQQVNMASEAAQMLPDTEEVRALRIKISMLLRLYEEAWAYVE